MTIKYWNFYMAVILNLLMLLGVKGRHIYYPDGARTFASYVAIVVVASILLLGYFVIIVYFTMSQYQLVWRAFTRSIRHDNAKHIDYTDFKPLKTVGLIAILYVMMCVAHAIGFAKLDGEMISGYIMFGCVLIGLYLLKSLRICVLVPKGPFVRFMVTTYDVFTNTKVAATNLCFIFTLLGFWKPFFFTIILFDIISLSAALKNTVRSVIQPLKTLALTAMLFVVVILVFSTVGYEIYEAGTPDDEYVFCEDCDEDSPLPPQSYLDAFWMVLNAGVRTGDIGEVMSDINHESTDYYGRILYMLAFFIILGVLLFNMVTGIILDEFGKLREATAERDDIIANESFISGITRNVYDEYNLPFEQLKNKDQCMWNYVYFMLYLDQKEKAEFSGAENYVWQCLQADDPSWFPTRTSYALEQLNTRDKEEQTLEEQIQELREEFKEKTDEQYEKLSQQMVTILKSVHKS